MASRATTALAALAVAAAAADTLGSTFSPSAPRRVPPRALLLPCNNSHPLGQHFFYWTGGDSRDQVSLEFQDAAGAPLKPRTCLGVAGNDTAGWRLAPQRCDTGPVDWRIDAVWSGGGSTMRPISGPSSTLCITTTTRHNSPLTLSPCRAMPPPPDGYPNCTQTFYYGAGGLSADQAFSMSEPPGGGVATPAYCITMTGSLSGEEEEGQSEGEGEGEGLVAPEAEA